MIEIIHKIGYNVDEKIPKSKNEWKCNTKETFP